MDFISPYVYDYGVNIKTISNLALAFAITLLMAVMISRPTALWTDEYLQFAFGAYDSPWKVLEIIHTSTQETNHGQTGFYFFLDYLLLHYGGASYFLLRLPSFLAFAASLTMGVLFLRNLGCSVLTQALYLLGMGACNLNLLEATDARSYMPLQATVIVTLWAWQRATEQGRSLWPLFIAGLMGILFHVFFCVYLALIILGGLIFFPAQRAFLQKLWKEKKIINLVLPAIVWLLVFILVGKYTWFQTLGVKHRYDPYEWIGQSKYPLPLFTLAVFFDPPGKIWLPILCFVGAVLAWRRKEISLQPLWLQSIYLFALILLTQFLLVQITIAGEYWLLQRQWMAGLGLSYLLCAILVESAQKLWAIPRFALRLAFCFTMLVTISFATFKIRYHLQTALVSTMSDAEYQARLAGRGAKPEDVMSLVEVARESLLRHDPVHPIFKMLYGN